MGILKVIFNKKAKINVRIEISECPNSKELKKHLDGIMDYFRDEFPDNDIKCGNFSGNGIKGNTDIQVSYSKNFKSIGLKSKQIINDAEHNGIPVFVFTAKDRLSTNQIVNYAQDCKESKCKERHVKGIMERIKEFNKYQDRNQSKVSLPD